MKKPNAKNSESRKHEGLEAAVIRTTGMLVMLFALTVPSVVFAASASPAYDGIDYSTGDLKDRDGGTGDWKDKWSGAGEIRVESPGFAYTDGSGNELTVSGNRVGKNGSANDVKEASRELNSTVNSGTAWVSALIDGHGGSRAVNVGLGDGLYMGQGGKDSGNNRLGLEDADGNQDEASSSFSTASLHFLVMRVDFSGGDEEAWLWIDPDLDSEPATGAADAHLGSVKEFEFDKIYLWVQRNSSQTGIDEVRIGSTFASVTPHASSVVCGNGVVESGEDCDDGGNSNGDCCSSSCQFETGSCDDGLFCSTGETCTAGVCDGGGVTDCSGSGDQCNTGVCNENSNACEASASNEGGACDDSLFCNTGETCTAGVCDGGGQRDCSPSSNVCNLGTCNEAGNLCLPTPANEGFSCDDFDPDTINDQCSVGVCLGERSELPSLVPTASNSVRLLMGLVLLAFGIVAGRMHGARSSD